MPHEIMAHIFVYVGFADLEVVNRTCKRFYEILKMDYVRRMLEYDLIRELQWDGWETKSDQIYHVGRSGSLRMVAYLTNKEKYCNIINWVMRGAIKGGHLAIVKYLLEKKIYYVGLGASATYAAKKGHLPVVKYLVEKSCEGECLSAFYSAVRKGHIDVVKFFVNRDVIIKENVLKGSVALAKKYEHNNLVEYLQDVLERFPKETYLLG